MINYRQPSVSPFRRLSPLCVRTTDHMNTLAETYKRSSPPPLRAYGKEVDSFYHLAGNPANTACQGTACFVGRHLDLAWETACAQSPRVYCLGKCYSAPA